MNYSATPLLLALALLPATARGQCLGAPTGVPLTLVTTTAGTSADDQGRTVPAIPLGFNFPMAGALQFGPTPGVATHVFVESNGEIYLTNAYHGLFRPINPSWFGLFSLFDLRGYFGGSPRIGVWSTDLVAGNAGSWNILLDTSVPNQVTVRWHDVWLNTGFPPTGSSDFSCTLFSTGVIEMSWALGNPAPADVSALVGVSIGNDVGTGNEAPSDLSFGPDSGSLGLLYEEFKGVVPDLDGRTLQFVPNGQGGYAVSAPCASARNERYGFGCYDIQIARESFFEFFTGSAGAATALSGNAMQMSLTPTGYVATWIQGGAAALFVPPTASATRLPPSDDGDDLITLSSPLTIPGGTATQLTVSHNGIVTVGTLGNSSMNPYPERTDLAWYSGQAWYTWSDFNDTNFFPTPSGTIAYEELGGVLYITWDNVDHRTQPTASAPCRFQFQFDLASGEVTFVWDTIAANVVSTSGYLVGYTDDGLSLVASSIPLATSLPLTVEPDIEIKALSLDATPAPLITQGGTGPSVPVSWTLANVPDVAPPSGVGVSLLLFSTSWIPGFDLGFLGLTNCNLNILSFDVIVPFPGFAPLDNVVLTVPQPLPAGFSLYAQALSLFAPNSLPNGQNPFGGILSNGLRSVFNVF